MKIEGNIWKFYLYSLFNLMNFYGPVYIIYFQHFSLSLTQIFSFLSVYGVVNILFQVPTGVFADYMGRKKTLVLSAMFFMLFLLSISTGYTYWQFLLGYVFLGISSSMASGTDTSLIYDSLIQMRRKKDYKKIYGTYYMFGQIGLIVGALLGGYMLVINLRLPYVATMGAELAVLFAAVLFVEPSRKFPSRKLQKHLKKSFDIIRKNKDMLYLVLFYTLFYSSIVFSWFLVQPYYKAIGLRPEQFGIALAAGYLIAAFFARNSHKIETRLGKNAVILMAALLFAGYLIPSQIGILLGILPLYLISISQGIGFPVLNDYVNRRIKSYNRATVLSINAFMLNLSMAIFAPLLGIITDTFSIQTALLVMAIAVLLLSLLLIPKILKH